jgi:hypothetical protein
MHTWRRHLRPAAWLAAAAVCLLALLPTLGHVWGAGASGLSLVCGAQGARWVALAGEGAPAPAAKVTADCPACPACLWTAAMPPAPAPGVWLAPVVAEVMVPAPATSPVPAGGWRIAAPRGPPQG